MIKNLEEDMVRSTWNKAGKNEPLFILRGQDLTSPLCILEWIKLNFETAPTEKLEEAFALALSMKSRKGRKTAD